MTSDYNRLWSPQHYTQSHTLFLIGHLQTQGSGDATVSHVLHLVRRQYIVDLCLTFHTSLMTTHVNLPA